MKASYLVGILYMCSFLCSSCNTILYSYYKVNIYTLRLYVSQQHIHVVVCFATHIGHKAGMFYFCILSMYCMRGIFAEHQVWQIGI